MSRPSILTPDQLRNAPLIGGGGMPPRRQPTLDELVENFIQGLTAAAEKDLNNLPALLIYAELGEQLRALGMSKDIVARTLPKIKVGAPESFVQHTKFKEFVRLFAVMIHKLYAAVQAKFGDDADPLFLTMVEDRFALVIPVE
ncbi:hypothetical protein EKK58_01260 [Candidatus Dependentiae bacterium]|nr:MAG: hypothetical protein EKK58_01260 [Candidatus Dependentiae bacterium]